MQRSLLYRLKNNINKKKANTLIIERVLLLVVYWVHLKYLKIVSWSLRMWSTVDVIPIRLLLVMCSFSAKNSVQLTVISQENLKLTVVAYTLGACWSDETTTLQILIDHCRYRTQLYCWYLRSWNWIYKSIGRCIHDQWIDNTLQI